MFVSSHVLGEVQQLADVIGIIASGRLVREGPIDQLLHGEGEVRVRVAPAELDAARAPSAGSSRDGGVDASWPATTAGSSVRIDPSRAAEVNRALAVAGIYASGLETGSDLESLFLELTRGEHDGKPRGHVLRARRRQRAADATPARPRPTRRPGGAGAT